MGNEARASESYEIATLTRGGYVISPNPTAQSSRPPLVIGFHGYGEDAERHLEKLEGIPGSRNWQLCAVRALNRFYNPKTGEVIGCWMTSLGREHAIDDNNRYVAAIVARLQKEPGGIYPLVFAGFSQGVAMAYRAALRCGFPCAGLILLAGDVPPDVAAANQPLPPILLGRGTTDPLYSAAKMDADLELLKEIGAEVETCIFDGGHEWSPDFYAAAGAFLARVRNDHLRAATGVAR